MKSRKDAHEIVRKAYGDIAKRQTPCCQPKAACCRTSASTLPEAELGLSCGDPVGLAEIREGEMVVDLGSGGGKDVFLAAEKTGPTGQAIGMDMTQEMLELAKRNAAKFRQRTGLGNVEFREGKIEELPLENASVDLVISNCVINLSPDKPKVFREIFRVLKPGGRMVVSDVVLNEKLPGELLEDERLYTGCVAGALIREDYLKAIRNAGFGKVEVLADRNMSLDWADPMAETWREVLEGAVASITVRATRKGPGRASAEIRAPRQSAEVD